MIKVFVYWNVRQGCFSVKHDGKVIAHCTRVIMRNVEFKVSEAGRQRVLREMKKNVHAGMVGELVAGDTFDYPLKSDKVTWAEGLGAMSQGITEAGKRVSYNPFKSDTFFTCDDQRPIYGARMVYGRASGGPKPSAKRASLYAN